MKVSPVFILPSENDKVVYNNFVTDARKSEDVQIRTHTTSSYILKKLTAIRDSLT